MRYSRGKSSYLDHSAQMTSKMSSKRISEKCNQIKHVNGTEIAKTIVIEFLNHMNSGWKIRRFFPQETVTLSMNHLLSILYVYSSNVAIKKQEVSESVSCTAIKQFNPQHHTRSACCSDFLTVFFSKRRNENMVRKRKSPGLELLPQKMRTVCRGNSNSNDHECVC